MATAKQLLEAIELQKLVPESVLDELYEEYRGNAGSISAEKLATRMVEIDALSEDQVGSLLSGLDGGSQDGMSGVDLGTLHKAASSGDDGDPFDEPSDEGGELPGRRKHVAKKHKNDFDSPLLLIGGGVLALLLLGGVALAFLMNLQSGDQLIESAKEAYDSGSYSQARDDLEQFVEDFSGHARWSEARVSLAVTKLRQLVETTADWPRALAVAQEELAAVEDESAFAEQRSEFASLLPRVARGLAERADKLSVEDAPVDEIQSVTALTDQALTLVRNTKYVPKSLRDDGDLAEIDELLARVERRRETAADLVAAVAAIQAATDAGRAAEAYAAHSDLLVRRPTLREDERLLTALTAAVTAEREAVRFVESPAEASGEDRPSGVALALPLADTRRAGRAEADGVYVTRYNGIAYGLDAASGALLWRRPIGECLASVDPVYLENDVLLIDHRHGDLIRLDSETGKLVWRVEIEDPESGAALFAPASVGDRVLVASESGRLWAVDARAGTRIGYAEFAQPLSTSPAGNGSGDRVYVLGRQSSLYVVEPESLSCVAVKYTGHAPGAAITPPILVGERVVVLSNTGDATSQLSVYATDRQGAPTERLADWRQEGLVTSAASVAGRRVLSQTDSGAAYLYEASAGQDEKPLSLLSARVSEEGSPFRRRAVALGGEVWIAGRGLLRMATSLADSQLIVQAIPDPCDADQFVAPLVLNNKSLLHSRVRDSLAGITCSATDIATGALRWETDLASPPLRSPDFVSSLRGVVVTNASGETHLVGPKEIKSRVSAEPRTQPRQDKRYPGAAGLPRGVAVLAVPGDKSWVATTIAPRAGSRRVTLPGELATVPSPMGGGLLAPLSIGQVLLVDPLNRPLAAPFQPQVEVGSAVPWTPPAVAEAGGETLAVLSDGGRRAFCLAVEGESLVARGQAELSAGDPIGPAAIAAEHAAFGVAGGRLELYGLPAMDPQRVVELPGELVWGPHSAGDTLLAATADGSLLSVTPATAAIAWRADLGSTAPVGKPLIVEDGLILVMRDGRVIRLNPGTGAELASSDLGQRPGSGANSYSKRLLVAAADGSVLVVNKP